MFYQQGQQGTGNRGTRQDGRQNALYNGEEEEDKDEDEGEKNSCQCARDLRVARITGPAQSNLKARTIISQPQP